MRTTICTLVLGLSLAAGCSKSSPDTAPPEVEADVPAVAARPLTVTEVHVDEGIAALCDIDAAEVDVEVDTAAEVTPSPVLTELATCVTGGALQGRRLQVVEHADADARADYLRRRGESRAAAVRALLLASGVPDDGVLERAAGRAFAGEAGREPRRVDVLLAPLHGR